MNTNDGKSKWIGTVRTVLAIVAFLLFILWISWLLFLPIIVLIILFLLEFARQIIRDHFSTKKEYQKSAYYKDFGKKFHAYITVSPAYRLYNGAVERNLPVRFPESLDDKVDGLSYFFYEDTMYLFPNFWRMRLSEDGRAVWQVNYERIWVDFGGVYDTMRERAMYPGQTVKFLVERSQIIAYDLTETPLPSCVHVIKSYETAFENDESALAFCFPKSPADLYGMMRATPDLCGEYELAEDGESIRWRIREDKQITLAMHGNLGLISVEQVQFAKVKCEITHWHCTVFDMYDVVCKIGKRGNVLVLRTREGSGTVLYSGSKDECPYKPDKKYLFAKYYYIEAK